LLVAFLGRRITLSPVERGKRENKYAEEISRVLEKSS